MLDLTGAEQSFHFVDVPEPPVPSLLRGFSAPAYLETDLSRAELGFLMGHDPDSFNRWEAGQQLATAVILERYEAIRAGEAPPAAPEITEAFRGVLTDRDLDPALAALAMRLPDERSLAERLDGLDPEALHESRAGLRAELGRDLAEEFAGAHTASLDARPYTLDPDAMGRRSLKNRCLGFMLDAGSEEARSAYDALLARGLPEETAREEIARVLLATMFHVGAQSPMLEKAGGGAGLRKEAFTRLAAGETARQIFEGSSAED